MSAQGPSATTRLVLFAHSQFMDRDGSRCRVGVRHLAEATGLNKTTVAEHRSLALRLGWLIGSKPSRGRGSGELYPAAPDGVKIVETGQASGESGQAPNPPIEVSGLNPETVRNEPQNCPAIPDVPPIPIKPLREKLNAFRKGMSTEARRSAPSREGLKEQLRNWLENDETVKQYLRIADIEAIIKLTPERLRVSDYEEQILNLIEEIALGGAA
jgi:hypothetical protein